MALELVKTKRFFVFSTIPPSPLLRSSSIANLESDVETDDTDMPLNDLCLQIVLESLNLAPCSFTEKVPTLVSCDLLPPLCPPYRPSIVIEQDRQVSMQGQGGTGGVIWPSAEACTHFLVHHYFECGEDCPKLGDGSVFPRACAGQSQGRDHQAQISGGVPQESSRSVHHKARRGPPSRVLEIGSGTGLLGIAAACLFQAGSDDCAGGGAGQSTQVWLTDQRNVVPLLRRNAASNGLPSPAPKPRLPATPSSSTSFEYSADAVQVLELDWNVERDRERVVNAVLGTTSEDAGVAGGSAEEQRQQVGVEGEQRVQPLVEAAGDASGEVLVLCSDLVFGNRFEHLIDLLEALQTASRSPPPQPASSKNRNPRVHILFSFEEREDRYPSPGFFPALRERFHLEHILPPPQLLPRAEDKRAREGRVEHDTTTTGRASSAETGDAKELLTKAEVRGPSSSASSSLPSSSPSSCLPPGFTETWPRVGLYWLHLKNTS